MHPAFGSPGNWVGAAAVGFLVYRRLRRNFGQQRWQPRRMWLRLVLVSVVAVVVLAAGFTQPHGAWAVPLALLIGAALGVLGLRRTHAHWQQGQRMYTPDAWIGAALSLLLIGRLAWRWVEIEAARPPSASAHLATLVLAALLFGYSIAYSGGLILRMRALGETAPASTAD